MSNGNTNGMTFLEALKTGRPMRQASWVGDLWLYYSWPTLRWLLRTGTGEEYDVRPLDDMQGVMTPTTLLATDWVVMS